MPESHGFSDRLFKVRESLHLSQQQAADAIGCDRGYLSRLERGKQDQPSEMFIAAVVLRLGVSEPWLRAGVGDPFVSEAPGAVVQLSTVDPRLAAAEAALRRVWRYGCNQQRTAVSAMLTALDPGEKKERPGDRDADEGMAGGVA